MIMKKRLSIFWKGEKSYFASGSKNYNVKRKPTCHDPNQ
jgi:hypothetical protein